MKISRKILFFITFLLIMTLMSCSKEDSDSIIEKQDSGNDDSQKQMVSGKYSTQGKVVKIDETGLHVQTGDTVHVYNVDAERTKNFYIGEYVGLNKLDGDKYDAVLDQYYDYNTRFTSTGEAMKRVSGTVGDVDENYVYAVTEMGNVKFTNPGGFDLKTGDQFMVDYIELAGTNQMLSFYDEASKINVTVKEIVRDTNGMMRIYGVSDDNMEYDIKIGEDAIVNFAHSSLKIEDRILVYPEKINDDVPAGVNAKLIVKSGE